MYKLRVVLSKQEPACYLSHLDFMKALQRSFVRAGLPVRYSQGFNPHIEMSLPAPLSTGYRGLRELCDVELEGEELPDGLLERLNAALPRGMRARACGPAERPAREIAAYAYALELPAGDEEGMAALFRAPVPFEKRSKRGRREVNLCDYIRTLTFSREGEGTLCRCTLAAGDDPLNRLYLTAALRAARLVPEDAGVRYTRTHILDESLADFCDFPLLF